MNFNPYILLIFVSVAIASISQILLKKAAQKEYKTFLQQYLNVYVISGYGLLLLTTVINVIAYRGGVQLKSGAVIESLGFILVMVLSRMIFQEKISRRKMLGNLLIIAGVIIFHL